MKKQNLVKVFTKGLNKDDQKDRLFKRLKIIEDNNEELLKIKNKTEKIKEITNPIKEPSSPEAMALFEEIKTIQKMFITENQILLVVMMLYMILVILKHSMIYLKTFFLKK